MSRRRWVRATAALGTVAAVACSVAACSGGRASAVPSPPPVTATATASCPSVAPAPTPTTPKLTSALRNLPFDLPMPDNISVVATRRTTGGINVVQFTTPTSLRDAVLFILGRYPKAGYVLGRGDAEATEADAPFIRNGVRGLTRLAAVDACKTMWLVASSAASAGGTSPLLSPHPTSSQTSALPFG